MTKTPAITLLYFYLTTLLFQSPTHAVPGLSKQICCLTHSMPHCLPPLILICPVGTEAQHPLGEMTCLRFVAQVTIGDPTTAQRSLRLGLLILPQPQPGLLSPHRSHWALERPRATARLSSICDPLIPGPRKCKHVHEGATAGGRASLTAAYCEARSRNKGTLSGSWGTALSDSLPNSHKMFFNPVIFFSKKVKDTEVRQIPLYFSEGGTQNKTQNLSC